jgi:uncharacterized protein YjeT (DUF2065 family)
MLRIERKPLTSSRQMLRHNAPKTAAWRRAIQTIAAEPDTSEKPYLSLYGRFAVAAGSGVLTMLEAVAQAYRYDHLFAIECDA